MDNLRQLLLLLSLGDSEEVLTKITELGFDKMSYFTGDFSSGLVGYYKEKKLYVMKSDLLRMYDSLKYQLSPTHSFDQYITDLREMMATQTNAIQLVDEQPDYMVFGYDRDVVVRVTGDMWVKQPEISVSYKNFLVTELAKTYPLRYRSPGCIHYDTEQRQIVIADVGGFWYRKQSHTSDLRLYYVAFVDRVVVYDFSTTPDDDYNIALGALKQEIAQSGRKAFVVKM